MAIFSPMIKPISRNQKHLGYTDNLASHEVFEHKLIAIYLRFFVKWAAFYDV